MRILPHLASTYVQSITCRLMVRRDTNANSAFGLQWKGHTKRPLFFLPGPWPTVTVEADRERGLDLNLADDAAAAALSESEASFPALPLLRIVFARLLDGAVVRRDLEAEDSGAVCASSSSEDRQLSGSKLEARADLERRGNTEDNEVEGGGTAAAAACCCCCSSSCSSP